MSLFSGIIPLFIALFGVGFLIGFHELGHFLFCKLFNIKTPSFSIGFGPRIFSRKIGETDFALSAIPLGGYVEMATQYSKGEVQSNPRLFANKPYYQKLLVMLGGIGFNLIFAYAAIIGITCTGLPNTPLLHPFTARPTISMVEEGSPAAFAGLAVGDRIQTINSIDVDGDVKKVTDIIRPLAGQTVSITYERNGHLHTANPVLESREVVGEQIGALGVGFETEEPEPATLWEGITRGFTLTNALIKGTVLSFANLFLQGRKGFKQLGGPLMVISMTMKGVNAGIKILLVLLAIISINLAILNCIPVPVMDGGQILFHSIEAALGRPLPDRVREYIHLATWLLLLGLIFYLTVWDMMRILPPYIEALRSTVGL